ncbi:hypothetical protein STHAL_32030 [Streptomyces halstedii]|uniref:Uncharacterized protein n=1 Tax=Streptomyces halstedii TaxID=1944 RepID=A0ABS6U0K0_STRHA|nr:hypothetical protein [Streptomyces halstedii]MBV7674077.1 hypothetical protein [Streptomyces halstedii]
MEYTVTWKIELDVHDPVEAARKALAIQRNPGSWATVFTIHDGVQAVTVDLDPEHLDPSGGGEPKVALAA